jgi:hypothetical protein
MVPSASEPVSLQPISSSGSRKQEPVDRPKPADPPKLVDPVDAVGVPPPANSSSSLMEASCESEILELELQISRPELPVSQAEPEPPSCDVISCDLVSVSEDPAPKESEAKKDAFDPDETGFSEFAADAIPPIGKCFKTETYSRLFGQTVRVTRLVEFSGPI